MGADNKENAVATLERKTAGANENSDVSTKELPAEILEVLELVRVSVSGANINKVRFSDAATFAKGFTPDIADPETQAIVSQALEHGFGQLDFTTCRNSIAMAGIAMKSVRSALLRSLSGSSDTTGQTATASSPETLDPFSPAFYLAKAESLRAELISTLPPDRRDEINSHIDQLRADINGVDRRMTQRTIDTILTKFDRAERQLTRSKKLTHGEQYKKNKKRKVTS